VNATDLCFETLKAKHREVRDAYPDSLNLRIHRALSWYGRAELAGDDDDAVFVFYWIAFNAAYAHDVPDDTQPRERALFEEYFARLTDLDRDKRIFNVIWTRFPQEIRLLLENRYVYQPFWHHQNQVPGYSDWEARFEASKNVVNRALRAQDTNKILSILFERLYVLRNQLVHGGASWNSKVNRDQVRDGRRILASLLPVFIDVMIDRPEVDWGAPYYPVVD
jgi:hypothetical protein